MSKKTPIVNLCPSCNGKITYYSNFDCLVCQHCEQELKITSQGLLESVFESSKSLGFSELLDELKKLHIKKNAQYASTEDPLGNFKRGSQIVKKFFREDLQNDPERLAAAYAIILATKQIDGAIEIIAENKKNTVDSLQEKLRDVMVYFGIVDCMENKEKDETNNN